MTQPSRGETSTRVVATSAEALRQEFDRTFAIAPAAIDDARESVLMIQAGGDPYAVRLAQIAAVFADKQVMWLPGSVRELLAIVAVRGSILPVYDLGALLGYASASATPRWFVTVASAPVALAFDRFDGHRKIAREALSAVRADPHARHIREVLGIDGLSRPMVDLSSVVEAIAALSRVTPRAKE
jgi:purine-binding chemotaxis protein CheW